MGNQKFAFAVTIPVFVIVAPVLNASVLDVLNAVNVTVLLEEGRVATHVAKFILVPEVSVTEPVDSELLNVILKLGDPLTL